LTLSKRHIHIETFFKLLDSSCFGTPAVTKAMTPTTAMGCKKLSDDAIMEFHDSFACPPNTVTTVVHNTTAARSAVMAMSAPGARIEEPGTAAAENSTKKKP
jgi:hypothetical protein